MSTLFPRLLKYIHRTGAFVKGTWVVSESDATFTGSIQPVTGKDTLSLPVLRRDTGSVKVYSDTPLSVSAEGGHAPGDLVQWGGRYWEIYAALPFQNGLLDHYKYLAADFCEDREAR